MKQELDYILNYKTKANHLLANWGMIISHIGKSYTLTNTRFFRTFLMLLLMVVSSVGAWAQHPFTLTTPEQHAAHSGETLYWIESRGAQGFFAIPKANSDDADVTTSNMPNEMMLWYFMDAGTDGGKQYYYIVNKSTGKYLRLKGNNGADNSIGIKTFAANNDSYKFSISGSEGQWLFSPKSSNSHFINKKGSNVNYTNGLKSSDELLPTRTAHRELQRGRKPASRLG